MDGNIETWQALAGAAEVLAIMYGGFKLVRSLKKEPEPPSGLELSCNGEIKYFRDDVTSLKGSEIYHLMRRRGEGQ
jgi:hypothetical protein